MSKQIEKMKIPIPNRIIRLIFRELIYLKFEERSEFQPIGVAYRNATKACPFGREMVDRVISEIINKGLLQSNSKGETILESQYKFTPKGKELVEKGNYEEVFQDCITTRNFFFTNNGEFGFSDIYEKDFLKWKLLKFEIDTDQITKEYFNIAKHLNYQIWKSNAKIYLAAKYLGHIRMFEIPAGKITKMKLEIYSKGKEPSKIRLLIADSKLRGTIMEGNINEYNSKNYNQRIWELENRVIPDVLKIFNAKLTGTKKLVNA